MKIIIAHYKYYIQGGPERYMIKFMELSKKMGCDIIPFSVDNEQNIPTDYASYFVDSNNRNGSGRFALSELSLKSAVKGFGRLFHNRDAYEKIKALMIAEKPDLLYCLIPGQLTTDIFKAAKELGIPVILRISDFRYICGNNILLRQNTICEECIHGKYGNMVCHKCIKGSIALSMIRYLSLNYQRKKRLFDNVDAVITPPRFTAEKYIESGFFPKEKVYVNPTFVDCSNIVPHYEHRNYILCLGRFSPEKGFIYVVEALRYLMDIPVTVAVTGDKENCDSELRNVIEKFRLEEKVEFVGFLHGEDLNRVTAEAMCIACPAIWYENLPNTVLEAYSYGKPVIASNLGSLAEIVDDGETGLLFESKNTKQIADCIRKLYENPLFCSVLGHNARRKCEEEFNPEAHWQRFMNIYNTINDSVKR